VTAYNPEDGKKKLNKTEDNEVPKKVNDKNVPVTSNKFIEAVYVVSGDSVNRRDVETGIQDQDYIHILSGLEQGDEVVTGPYTAISRDLKQGSKIRRKKEKDKK
jgi:HlyD family secretion protein